MSPYRLLALDIDGTLLNSAREVTPRTRSALDRAREAGVRLALVTGRRFPSVRPVAEALGGVVDVVLHNGALVMEGENVLRCQSLSLDTARRAILVGREAGLTAVAHLGRRGEGRRLVEGGVEANPVLSSYLRGGKAEFVPDLVAALDDDPVQVMFGGALEAMAAFRPRLESALGLRAAVERTEYPSSGVAILDVLAPGVSKAEAVRFLQARFGVRPEETMAVGDNWNDRLMLEEAGLGLVMGNADPALRALGLPVLPSSDEDGVAEAVERYLLRDSSGAAAVEASPSRQEV